MNYYEIAPAKIIRGDKSTLTYNSEPELSIGQIVEVTAGRIKSLAVVTSKVKKPDFETKPVSRVIDLPALPKPLLKTAVWIHEYYDTHLALVLQTLLPRGLEVSRRARQKPTSKKIRNRTNFVFNKDQFGALKSIEETKSGTVILHGVTGSGKTAVYIELAKRTLAVGKSVIVLTPEIALTPQIVDEFSAHFDNTILTHSQQTEAERHLAWLEALNAEEPRVAIGPRSALFLPLSDIGLIIIDEAHEPSYKQDQSPRYSALRVASVLASNSDSCKVVQGSATPLISEYYLAQKEPTRIISIPSKARHDVSEPEILLVDMKTKTNFNKHRFFSDIMLNKIEEAVMSGSQALIFHNRRGSASTTLCENCGWSASCPTCYLPLTLHADRHELRCHVCDYKSKIPLHCPDCESTDIIHKGIGTKLIESELRKIFPDKKIMRFDGDNKKDDTLEKYYDKLYSGEIDIIIGTQIIAKGLDLPKLRHVSVIQADAGLALPDYAASERAFQLLAQVIGRVGRDKHTTSVVVQSYQPTAASISFGIAGDYASFYEQIIKERQRSKFPPFRFIAKFTTVYKTQAAAISNSKKMAGALSKKYPEIEILGPTPSFYERQHGTYRWQIVARARNRRVLVEAAQSVPKQKWQVDIDPISLI